METWRQIPGYERLYEVSDTGRVRSLPRTVAFGTAYRTTKAAILSQVERPDGYRSATLSDGKAKMFLVHRLVLLAFSGPCPAGMESRHLNGARHDNRKANLEWATPTLNATDRIQHGTHNKGSRHGIARLTEHAVCRIHERRAMGCSHSTLAKEFDISRTTISYILSGKRWGHVCAP